ncbi:unnamed protein product [Phytophthora fragariaefolia]|uniref:Unnamed protein product n=1 Tax=Phytophthora fragariaefolia TaxID=1490495 RepID=A0A9W6U9Y7_9STRA|nr:unnamed protein product [Phytophthora fragariaefolia]
MHFWRALPSVEVTTTENDIHVCKFSSKNSLAAPPKVESFSDLIGALSAFHKFAKCFYNKETKFFVAAAGEFVISYADTGPLDPAMARLITHWINSKFSKFRSKLITIGLKQAIRIRKEIKRNDEQLVDLKESYSVWKSTTASTWRGFDKFEILELLGILE